MGASVFWKDWKNARAKRNDMNKKGISPTIAAVILIAVTVAISLAVAAWTGALTFLYMKTEELTIINVSYQGTSGVADNHIVVTLQNTGTTDATLTQAKVSGHVVDKTIDFVDVTISKGEIQTITLNNVGWHSGYPYSIELISSKGNKFPTIETA